MGFLKNIAYRLKRYPEPKECPVIRHPRWQVTSYEELSEPARALLWEAIFFCIDAIPFKDEIVDVELCGSMAFGCANPLYSDFDFNIVFKDEETQEKYKIYWWDASKRGAWFREFAYRIHTMRGELGCSFSIGCTTAKNKESNILFSHRDNKFYGKSWGEKKVLRMRWDKTLKKYIPAKRFH